MIPTLLFAAALSLSLPPSGARACGGPEYRALDFLIGSWTVTNGDGDRSTSVVRYDLNHCAIVENWQSATGDYRGRNIDAYNDEDQHWHRFFVDDVGHVHEFEGMRRDRTLDYTGTSTGLHGASVLNRLTIREEGQDRLSQLWQKSSDGGRTWTTAFQATYIRSQGP